MTKDEYGDFVLRYKGCGACFPMYHTLSRFEKMWFTAIQKDVAELEKENAELKHIIATLRQEKDNVSMHAKAMEVVAKTRSDQLTKAKTVLRNVIDYLGQFCSDYPDCVIEAEQFLREVEK